MIVWRFLVVHNEVDTGFAGSMGINVARRNSGGGAVYHDLGNVNCSFILRDSRKYTLKHFAEVIIRSAASSRYSAV